MKATVVLLLLFVVALFSHASGPKIRPGCELDLVAKYALFHQESPLNDWISAGETWTRGQAITVGPTVHFGGALGRGGTTRVFEHFPGDAENFLPIVRIYFAPPTNYPMFARAVAIDLHDRGFYRHMAANEGEGQFGNQDRVLIDGVALRNSGSDSMNQNNSDQIEPGSRVRIVLWGERVAGPSQIGEFPPLLFHAFHTTTYEPGTPDDELQFALRSDGVTPWTFQSAPNSENGQ